MKTVPAEHVGLSSTRLQHISKVMQGYVDQHKLAGLITVLARRYLRANFLFNCQTAADTASRSRGLIGPRFAGNFLTLQSEGAGNAGRPMRPLPRVQ